MNFKYWLGRALFYCMLAMVIIAADSLVLPLETGYDWSGDMRHWFFSFLTRSDEDLIQKLVFYGLILLGFCFLISIINQSEEKIRKICGRSVLLAPLFLTLSLFSQDLILRIISYQTIVD